MNGKRLLWFPLLLLFALTLAPTTGATENDVYAILYADKTLVFQYGDAPESGREVTETYPVDLDDYAIPWSDKGSTIKTVIFKGVIRPRFMAYWFSGFSALESIQGLDKVSTSAVTDMPGMFSGCARLTSLDVSGWDTSHVTDMSGIFSGCSKLKTLNFSGWDTSNVTSMWHMFIDCGSLTTLDLSGWDTSGVTNMGGMFWGCSALTTLDLSGWDTSGVTNMENMFRECSALTTLDLSGFDTSVVTLMFDIFSECSSLKTIYASEYFEAPYARMFDGCTSLVGGTGTEYDDSHEDSDYARIDNPPDAPGYFTKKESSVVRKPVTLTLKLRDSSGETVSMDDLRESVEIVPEVTIADDAPELKTADIFLVIYDSKGMMIDLQSWEVDLSQPLSFIRTTPIPQDKDASYVKFIMLSSNLTPLTAAQTLQ